MSDDKKPGLVVVSKAKAHVKAKDVSVGVEALDALSDMVAKKLDAAAEKAKADGRKVIKARDLE